MEGRLTPPSLAMHPPDARKLREIYFTALPPGQVDEAFELLAGMDGLEVSAGPQPNALHVAYSIEEYTLEGLESALVAQGFHLDNSLMHKLRRALVYYCESVQCDNMRQPERCVKCREVWIQAYEHTPHGDHDETPEEWRAYR